MEKARKKTLGVFPLYAKRYKSVYISVNNNTNLNFLKILSNYIIWDRVSQKIISRYCPFNIQYTITPTHTHPTYIHPPPSSFHQLRYWQRHIRIIRGFPRTNSETINFVPFERWKSQRIKSIG